MNKKLLVVGLMLLFTISVVSAEFENVNCFDYYRFGDVKFTDLYPAKVIYSPSDKVKLFYDIKNNVGSPIVEGKIKVLILYIGLEDVDRVEDNDIIDEFYAIEDLNLNKDDVYEGRFEWNIPKNAKPGYYAVNTYFLVKDKFNMAGLSFMTSVPAAMTTFKIENPDRYESILFDKNNTFVNDKKYLFRASIPGFTPDDTIKIKTNLVNEGNPKQVDLTYELHQWDSYNQDSKLDQFTKHEVKSLETGSNNIEYTLSNVPSGVYMTKISATNQDLQSIIKMRFFVPGGNGKIVYLGLDHFPIMQGDETSIVLCYENGAASPGDIEQMFVGKGSIKLMDSNDNILFQEEYGPVNTTPVIEGLKAVFSSQQKLTKAVLYANLYDENDILMDEVELEYDYSRFVSTKKNLKLKISRSEFKVDSYLDYAVEYKDDMSDSADGNVVVYLNNPDGKVVRMKESVIHDILKDRLDLEGLEKGNYILKVVEKDEYLSDEKIVTLTEDVSYSKYVIITLLILTFVVGIYWVKKR